MLDLIVDLRLPSPLFTHKAVLPNRKKHPRPRPFKSNFPITLWALLESLIIGKPGRQVMITWRPGFWIGYSIISLFTTIYSLALNIYLRISLFSSKNPLTVSLLCTRFCKLAVSLSANGGPTKTSDYRVRHLGNGSRMLREHTIRIDWFHIVPICHASDNNLKNQILLFAIFFSPCVIAPASDHTKLNSV